MVFESDKIAGLVVPLFYHVALALHLICDGAMQLFIAFFAGRPGAS